MKAKIFAIEVDKNQQNKGTVSIDIKVDDIDNWIGIWSKEGMFDIDINLSQSNT